MQVTLLLSTYLEKYALRPVFTEEEVEHYLMPVEDVVDSYVVESAGQPMCPAHLVTHPHMIWWSVIVIIMVSYPF